MNGDWELTEISFPHQNDSLRNYAVLVRSDGHERIIAEGLTIGPGDEITIVDPLLDGPPFAAQFRLADGRLAARAGVCNLTPQPVEGADSVKSARASVRRLIDEKGSISLPGLPEGAWSWNIEDPSGEVTVSGTLLHAASDGTQHVVCLLYTSPSPRDGLLSRMPSSA